MIAAIALTGASFGPGMLPAIRREGTTHVIAFLELALLVPPDVPLIRPGIDQLALA